MSSSGVTAAAAQIRLTIGRVAALTGLSIDTVRYYEREGLLPYPVLRENGRRVYTAEHVEWLLLCAAFRASGMPIAALRTYTELVRQGDGTAGDRLAVLRTHRDRVTHQLEDLSRCLELIKHKVAVYEDLDARGEPPTSCRAPGLVLPHE